MVDLENTQFKLDPQNHRINFDGSEEQFKAVRESLFKLHGEGGSTGAKRPPSSMIPKFHSKTSPSGKAERHIKINPLYRQLLEKQRNDNLNAYARKAREDAIEEAKDELRKRGFQGTPDKEVIKEKVKLKMAEAPSHLKVPASGASLFRLLSGSLYNQLSEVSSSGASQDSLKTLQAQLVEQGVPERINPRGERMGFAAATAETGLAPFYDDPLGEATKRASDALGFSRSRAWNRQNSGWVDAKTDKVSRRDFLGAAAVGALDLFPTTDSPTVAGDAGDPAFVERAGKPKGLLRKLRGLLNFKAEGHIPNFEKRIVYHTGPRDLRRGTNLLDLQKVTGKSNYGASMSQSAAEMTKRLRHANSAGLFVTEDLDVAREYLKRKSLGGIDADIYSTIIETEDFRDIKGKSIDSPTLGKGHYAGRAAFFDEMEAGSKWGPETGEKAAAYFKWLEEKSAAEGQNYRGVTFTDSENVRQGEFAPETREGKLSSKSDLNLTRNYVIGKGLEKLEFSKVRPKPWWKPVDLKAPSAKPSLDKNYLSLSSLQGASGEFHKAGVYGPYSQAEVRHMIKSKSLPLSHAHLLSPEGKWEELSKSTFAEPPPSSIMDDLLRPKLAPTVNPSSRTMAGDAGDPDFVERAGKPKGPLGKLKKLFRAEGHIPNFKDTTEFDKVHNLTIDRLNKEGAKINKGESRTNLNKFVTDMGIMESGYNKKAKSHSLKNRVLGRDTTTAAGTFQFTKESFETGLNRYRNITGETPDWWRKARKAEHPKGVTNLSDDQARAIALANLAQKKGTDPYLTEVAKSGFKGDAAKELYQKFHHTGGGTTDKRIADKGFFSNDPDWWLKWQRGRAAKAKAQGHIPGFQFIGPQRPKTTKVADIPGWNTLKKKVYKAHGIPKGEDPLADITEIKEAIFGDDGQSAGFDTEGKGQIAVARIPDFTGRDPGAEVQLASFQAALANEMAHAINAKQTKGMSFEETDQYFKELTGKLGDQTGGGWAPLRTATSVDDSLQAQEAYLQGMAGLAHILAVQEGDKSRLDPTRTKAAVEGSNKVSAADFWKLNELGSYIAPQLLEDQMLNKILEIREKWSKKAEERGLDSVIGTGPATIGDFIGKMDKDYLERYNDLILHLQNERTSHQTSALIRGAQQDPKTGRYKAFKAGGYIPNFGVDPVSAAIERHTAIQEGYAPGKVIEGPTLPSGPTIMNEAEVAVPAFALSSMGYAPSNSNDWAIMNPTEKYAQKFDRATGVPGSAKSIMSEVGGTATNFAAQGHIPNFAAPQNNIQRLEEIKEKVIKEENYTIEDALKENQKNHTKWTTKEQAQGFRDTVITDRMVRDYIEYEGGPAGSGKIGISQVRRTGYCASKENRSLEK